MEALIPWLLSAVSVIGLGLLVNLLTPKVQAWIRDWRSPLSAKLDLAGSGGGRVQVIPRSKLPVYLRRDQKVSGCLVVGSKGSDASEKQAPVQELKIGWRELGGKDIFNWLAWQARLVPRVVGRDRELDDLLSWAREGGPGPRARILSGPGGQGKTRLAAEVAESLQHEGWAAGFVDPRDFPSSYLLREGGALLLVDYPEERRAQVQELLEDLANIDTTQRVRVLLLTRHGEDLWTRVIDRVNASVVFDELPLELGPISPEATYEVFRLAQAYTPRPAEQDLPEPPSKEALQRWVDSSPSHRRPLFVVAAAVNSVLYPERPVLGLSGSEVVLSLVRRERKRLEKESEAAQMETDVLPRLVALAAVAGGLDRQRLRQLAEESDRLELHLPAPERIFERVKATGRVREGLLPAPTPDLFAAALVVEVLNDDVGMAPEWLWSALQADVSRGLQQVERLSYDAEVTLGLRGSLSEWLRECFDGHPERCALVLEGFREVRLAPGLLPSAKIAWEAALEHEEEEEKRAGLLNDLSAHLAAAGDVTGALGAIQQAVEIRRRLAKVNRARFEPDLARSLNNLSLALSDVGDNAGALKVIQEAVEIQRRLSEVHPALFEPDLAVSLYNLALGLSDAGDDASALEASQQATKIQRGLSEAHPFRLEPNLAQGLNILSVRLRNAGESAGALEAIKQAVDIRCRLAETHPARFEPDLAESLHNLSLSLCDAGDNAGALDAIQKAVDIQRRLSEAHPARYEPELALSLITLSKLLSDAGDGAGALHAIKLAVEIYRRLAEANPSRFEPDLALSLNNLFVDLSAGGDDTGALEAIEQAVDIRRRLAEAHPSRFESDLAVSLNNLSNGLGAAGDGAGALEAIQEAVEIYRRHPAHFEPDLALSLNNLSRRLANAGNVVGALEASQQAVKIYRRLAEAHPVRFEPELALSLNSLSNRLNAAADGAGALEAIQEAVEIRRRLTEAHPARFEPDLAESLHNLSLRLRDAGDSANAREASQRAVDIYRRLAEAYPAGFEPDLANSLNSLSVCLASAGDVAGAVEAIQEAVERIRPIAEKYPEGQSGSWLRMFQANLERLEHRSSPEESSSP